LAYALNPVNPATHWGHNAPWGPGTTYTHFHYAWTQKALDFDFDKKEKLMH